MKGLKTIITIGATLLIVLTVLCVRILLNDREGYSFRIQRENVELMYEGARAELVETIDSTIRVYAPTTCMNGLEILRQCEKYGVDVFFVLTQAHKESHFATKGMAAKTNSAFNVYAYDGYSFDKINKNGKFSHPDLSIEPYLKLLTSRYLVDKTEMDLLHNYVDVNGSRYASSTEYEHDLTEIYQMYIANKKLTKCFQLYNKYKILAGK